jgi:hypothetical protein
MLLKNICSTGITYDDRHLRLSYFYSTGHKYHTVSCRYCEVNSQDKTKYQPVNTLVDIFVKRRKTSTLSKTKRRSPNPKICLLKLFFSRLLLFLGIYLNIESHPTIWWHVCRLLKFEPDVDLFMRVPRAQC